MDKENQTEVYDRSCGSGCDGLATNSVGKQISEEFGGMQFVEEFGRW